MIHPVSWTADRGRVSRRTAAAQSLTMATKMRLLLGLASLSWVLLAAAVYGTIQLFS